MQGAAKLLPACPKQNTAKHTVMLADLLEDASPIPVFVNAQTRELHITWQATTCLQSAEKNTAINMMRRARTKPERDFQTSSPLPCAIN
jgi:hypothetical protein